MGRSYKGSPPRPLMVNINELKKNNKKQKQEQNMGDKMSLNKVMIIGRLGQNPEFKTLDSGNGVCNFSLATSEKWKDKSGQQQEKTEWHSVVVWGKLAEVCNQYLAKGRQVFIEGRLETRSWDNNEGNKKYKTEINATNVQFLSGKDDVLANKAEVKKETCFTSDDILF